MEAKDSIIMRLTFMEIQHPSPKFFSHVEKELPWYYPVLWGDNDSVLLKDTTWCPM